MLDLLHEMTAVEYFAGIGLMRLGLEAAGWRVVWANDIDPQKQRLYLGHFGAAASHFVLGDVHRLEATTVPTATLATASFPCTDLSLAGARKGLAGPQSSALWGFLRVLEEQGPRRPPLVLLENVPDLLSSGAGRDFPTVAQALAALGYALDALILDAAQFAPLSRRRLFIIGVQASLLPDACGARGATPERYPTSVTRPAALLAAMMRAPAATWLLRSLPTPPVCPLRLDDVLDAVPEGAGEWWSEARVATLVDQMSCEHRRAVDQLSAGAEARYASVCRRTRADGVHAEVWGGMMGCLRKQSGGSSNPFLLRAGCGRVQVRRILPREAARLMGAPDYHLTGAYTAAMNGFGDAVSVDAVSWIARHYLDPLAHELP